MQNKKHPNNLNSARLRAERKREGERVNNARGIFGFLNNFNNLKRCF
jgi:hypothetical protein